MCPLPHQLLSQTIWIQLCQVKMLQVSDDRLSFFLSKHIRFSTHGIYNHIIISLIVQDLMSTLTYVTLFIANDETMITSISGDVTIAGSMSYLTNESVIVTVISVIIVLVVSQSLQQ